MLPLACCSVLLGASPPQSPPTIAPLPKHPVAALAAAVDLPSRAERAAAATELAARDLPLHQWLAAARDLRPRPRDADSESVDADTVRHRPRLFVFGGYRDSELLVRMPKRRHDAGPLPLLFVWHEAGGSGNSAMATWAPLADHFGWLLAAPTESYEQYRIDGWSYHPDGYEGMAAALRFVRRHYDIDEDRIAVAGLRGGGHMAWDVGLRYADQFAAIASANGSPRLGTPHRECNLAYLESIVDVPLRSLHWGAQEAAQQANVARAFEVLRGFGARHAERHEFADQARALDPNAAGWDRWFAARRAVPRRLVKFPDTTWFPKRADFGRHHWLEVLRLDPDLRLPFPPTVPTATWSRLDAAGRLAYVDNYLRQQLPRIEVRWDGAGLFDVDDRHVHAFRLLLPATMLGEPMRTQIEVHWRGHSLRKPIEPDAAVLLHDFVERFDRTQLPIAEVRLP